MSVIQGSVRPCAGSHVNEIIESIHRNHKDYIYKIIGEKLNRRIRWLNAMEDIYQDVMVKAHIWIKDMNADLAVIEFGSANRTKAILKCLIHCVVKNRFRKMRAKKRGDNDRIAIEDFDRESEDSGNQVNGCRFIGGYEETAEDVFNLNERDANIYALAVGAVGEAHEEFVRLLLAGYNVKSIADQLGLKIRVAYRQKSKIAQAIRNNPELAAEYA